MYSIGDLCRRFNISRSTILYYDKMKLLKSERNRNNNYRVYDEVQLVRLEKIIGYRESGVPLRDILKILDIEGNGVTAVLLKRVGEIQKEIRELKKQEQLVVDVLREEVTRNKKTPFTTSSWSELLESLGYDEESMFKWHREFERKDPELHREFLKNLKMTDREIEELIDGLPENF